MKIVRLKNYSRYFAAISLLVVCISLLIVLSVHIQLTSPKEALLAETRVQVSYLQPFVKPLGLTIEQPYEATCISRPMPKSLGGSFLECTALSLILHTTKQSPATTYNAAVAPLHILDSQLRDSHWLAVGDSLILPQDQFMTAYNTNGIWIRYQLIQKDTTCTLALLINSKVHSPAETFRCDSTTTQ